VSRPNNDQTFARLPNWLLRRPEVSAGAKLAYARLVQYCGRNGAAWPSLTTLAREVGASRRQTIRHVNELRDLGLIASERTGTRASNTYQLRAHPWATGDTYGTSDKSHTSLVSGMAPRLVTRTAPKKINGRHQGKEKGASRPARREVWQIQKDIEAIQGELDRLNKRATETATQRFFSDPSDAEAEAKLKAKLKELRKELQDA